MLLFLLLCLSPDYIGWIRALGAGYVGYVKVNIQTLFLPCGFLNNLITGHFFFEYRRTSYSIGVIIMKTEIAASYRLIKTANFHGVLFSGMDQAFILYESYKQSLSIYIIPGGR